MLRVEKLNSGYKELHILFDIDFSVDKRSITSVLGPNGSGKSTLLKSIFGLANVFSGRIFLNGREITFDPPHKKAKLGIVYLPQTENVFSNLTVKENLIISSYNLNEDEAKDRIEVALNIFPELKNFLKRKAGTLSGGERQMLALAMAIVRKAEVLMLDEPTAQLSPKFVDLIARKIVELRDDHGMTVVAVEQNARKALEISEKCYVLVSGKVVFEGKAQELLESKRFEKLCLGIVE